jgi:hypothetical protein
MLRRQGSKINIVATLDEEDEIDREAQQQPRMEKSDMFGRRARRIDNRKWLTIDIHPPLEFGAQLTHRMQMNV